MDLHTTGAGFKLGGYCTLSTELQTYFQHNSNVELCVRWCVWKVGKGFPDRVLPKTLRMGSCIFQCNVPHQWIAQRQVGSVSVYCDRVGCHALCLRHGIPV